MVTAGMLPRAAVREVEARLRAAGCPDADFDAAELFRLAAGGDVRLADAPLGAPPECWLGWRHPGCSTSVPAQAVWGWA